MNPMDNMTDWWVFHSGKSSVYPDGKWMLFYNTSELNNAWKKATELFENGHLPGIASMKCSTGKNNPRASSHEQKVIIFYCGQSENEGKMMKIGRQLVMAMRYKSPNTNFIYYKTNEQTDKGTAATGTTKNYLYKESVERSFVRTDNNDEPLPMSTTTEHQLVVTDPEYSFNISGLPSARMNFKPHDLDRNWVKAKGIFKDKLLSGFVGLKSETIVSAPRKGPFPSKRMQFIFGGDIGNMEENISFVQNIIKLMGTECVDENVGLYKFGGRKPVLNIPVIKTVILDA